MIKKKDDDLTPEEICRQSEKKINTLVEESAMAASNPDEGVSRALEIAKEAGKKERALCR